MVLITTKRGQTKNLFILMTLICFMLFGYLVFFYPFAGVDFQEVTLRNGVHENNEIILGVNSSVSFMVFDEDTYLLFELKSCDINSFDIQESVNISGNIITFNPYFQRVQFSEGEFILRDTTEQEKKDFFSTRALYVVGLDMPSQSFLKYFIELEPLKLDVEERISLGFNSRCEDAELKLSLEVRAQ